ncbi:hypothetical protein D3C73_1154070 [compost metagenome]
MQSDRHVHWWILSKIKTPSGRKRFMAHFQVADHDITDDTASRKSAKREWLEILNPGAALAAKILSSPNNQNVGLTHVLDLLTTTWHTNDHKLVALSAEAVEGDAFTFLGHATHARMISDAEFMLHSNGELRKKLWIGYLNAFNKMFGPMAAVGWPVALAVVGCRHRQRRTGDRSGGQRQDTGRAQVGGDRGHLHRHRHAVQRHVPVGRRRPARNCRDLGAH